MNNQGRFGKVALPILLTLLAVSLLMILYSYQIPTDITREVVQYVYTARGVVDYNVTLKPNTLYEDSFLVNPSRTFLRLVEKITLNVVYSLDLQPEISDTVSTLKVDLVLNHPQVWSRRISSTELQSEGNEVTYTIELDLESTLLLASNISREVDVPSSRYTIDVNCYGRTKFVIANQSVTVNYPFSLQITIDLFGKIVEFSPKNTAETRSQKSIVVEEAIISLGFINTTVRTLRNVAMASLLATSSFTALYTGLLIYRKVRRGSRDILVHELRKYKSSIIEALEIADSSHTVTVKVCNLGELARISEELLKPIVHIREQGKHVFYVLDGNVKYTYERDNSTKTE